MTALELLRAFVRYKTHAGYRGAAMMADGELICEVCAIANYRQIFRDTRDKTNSDWQVIGLTNSGEAEEGDTAQCTHCNKILWDAS